MDNLQLRYNNPYSTGTIFQFDDGTVLLDREPIRYIQSPEDRIYRAIDGDDLWSISHEAYGDSKYYWVIAEANQIDFPLDLESGSELIIPDLKRIVQA